MSVETQPVISPDGAPSTPPPVSGDGAWSVTWHGVRTVARLELRQRVRSTRWIVSLVVFGVVVAVISALTWGVARSTDPLGLGEGILGPTMFGFIVFFVLFLGLLVSPTLSATAINGDRSAGTLATLQVTLLSAAEIVLGKLLASWIASLAFLAVSVPFILWAFASGGTPALSVLTTLVLLAVMLAVVCAIGLGFSALTARTAGSAVLTYIAVAGLTIVSLIVFGLTVPLVSGNETVRVYEADYSSAVEPDENGEWVEPPCEWVEREQYVAHTERTWWLLAINPFVIVADAAPAPTRVDAQNYGFDPLTGIREGVRLARLGAAQEYDYCWEDDMVDGSAMGAVYDDRAKDLSPVWPWGLAANLLLGAAGVVLAVRRLRIPQRTLTKGTRVA